VLENRLQEVAVLFERLEAFHRRCGVSDDDAYVLTLVMEEVFTNVVRHGYPEEGGHRIAVRLELAGGVVTLVVEDDAQSFDPVQAPLADLDAPLDERRVGGLGVHLIRTLVDDVAYRRDGGRNVLTLRKKLQPKE
jgi:serine/threonine-protein kinase RsbW/sigma-B regulation protein RsbU (phosphoserine phosphatase)